MGACAMSVCLMSVDTRCPLMLMHRDHTVDCSAVEGAGCVEVEESVNLTRVYIIDPE